MEDNNKITRRSISAALLLSIAAALAGPSRLSSAAAIGVPCSCGSLPGLAGSLPEAVPVSPAAEEYPVDVLDIWEDKAYYLSFGQVDMSQVPPAPVAGSAVDKEDLSTVRRWQAERTEAQCEAAKAQADASYDEFFGEVSPFGNPAPEEVESIFRKVRDDTGAISRVLKERYKRPRPFLRDSAINPCIGRIGGYSYPSGHSTTARIFGLILSDLVPGDSGRFMSYADQAALNRVIGGVHHPSDIEAGKKLGDAVYKALKQNSVFNRDMKILRSNLKP